jgi:hypothetical protein
MARDRDLQQTTVMSLGQNGLVDTSPVKVVFENRKDLCCGASKITKLLPSFRPSFHLPRGKKPESSNSKVRYNGLPRFWLLVIVEVCCTSSNKLYTKR